MYKSTKGLPQLRLPLPNPNKQYPKPKNPYANYYGQRVRVIDPYSTSLVKNPYKNKKRSLPWGGGCGCNGNVQAKKDLDNLTMLYGEKVPQGAEIVGGSKCGDDGVGTSHPKSETFKQYLENMNEKLDLKKGGGFSIDPNEFIAGQAVVKSYDDCCPPAIVGGKLQFGAPDQPVCGLGAVRGGSRRKHHSMKKKSGKSHKKSHKSHKRHSKTRRSNKRMTQKGGDFTSLHSSKPAEFATAFNGPKGVFNYPENMMERTFDETQPMWSPKAI